MSNRSPLAIVLGSALLSFFQECSTNTAAERLRAQVTIKATVLRDGQARAVPAEEIVPGDVVQLSAGNLVLADGVVLEARDLYVNQAVLTGETFPHREVPRCRPRENWPGRADELRLDGRVWAT